MVIILVAIGGYYISGHWWLFVAIFITAQTWGKSQASPL
jgi:hypothetical protein